MVMHRCPSFIEAETTLKRFTLEHRAAMIGDA